ncbi:tyrosine-type recombinase/integrase [Planctomycetota bacterium]
MGLIEPEIMKLSQFQEDCLVKTSGQVREGTLDEYCSTMNQFIETVGDVDYRNIRHEHGERFIQACLKRGNSPATANKKIGSLKRIFQMAVQRRQIEDNPFRYVRKLKVTPRKIRIFSDKECQRMIEATRRLYFYMPLRWDILILTALCTGMRRGELLNTTWSDIDFEKQLIHISPNKNTELTWSWQIKDTDTRHIKLHSTIIAITKFSESLTPFTPYMARN